MTEEQDCRLSLHTTHESMARTTTYRMTMPPRRRLVRRIAAQQLAAESH